MWIVRLALRRPFTVAAFCLTVLLLGVLSAAGMAVDIFPTIDIPVVVVVWNYPGLSAEDMERRIVFVSERGISTSVSGVSRIDSQSIDGTGVERVYFEPGTDIGGAIAQIAASTISATRIMPPGTQPPVVLRYNASNVTVAQITLSGSATEQDLFDWGSNFLRIRLFTIPGLSTPAPYGGRQRQITVQIDPARAQARGVSPQDIVGALLSQNVILPAGSARMGTTDFDVLMNGSPGSVDEFNRLPVKAAAGASGGTVYLGDVGSVYDGYATQQNIVRVDGRRASYVAILKKENASTLAVVDTVREMLPALKAVAPQGVDLELVFDQSTFVRAAVLNVLREAVIAAGLVGLMVLAFVGSWRSTIIVCLSIPLSLLCGVIALKLMGQTFNLMTLGGLSLVIGMLVDDATVEIENVNRNRSEGRPILGAILHAASQVALPALAATLSICIVFFPVVLLTGPSRYLFFPLALAVVFSMLASYFLSRTLVPTLASMMLAHEAVEPDPSVAPLHPEGETPPEPERRGFWARVDQRRNHALERLVRAYMVVLEAAIARRAVVLACAVLFCAVSVLLVAYVGLDFFPRVDAGIMRFQFRAPPGTRIEQTERIVDAVEQRVRRIVPPGEIDLIDDNIGVPLYYNLGFIPTESASGSDAEVLVALKPKHHPTQGYQARIRDAIATDFPGSTLYFLPADVMTQVLNFGLPAQIDVQVQSRRFEDALPIALALENAMRKIPGAVDVRLGQVVNHPSLLVALDRDRALDVGLTMRDASSSVLAALSGTSLAAPNFWVNPKNMVSYSVVAQVPFFHIGDVDALMATPVTPSTPPPSPPGQTLSGSAGIAAPQPLGPQAPYLGSVATVERTATRSSIRHETVQPVVDVECAAEKRDLGSVASDIRRAIRALGKLPAGVSVKLAGQPQTMSTAFGNLGLGMLVSVALVYLLLVVLFQSWIDPLLILLAVPASLSGVLWMLAATGTTLNVESLMGSIMAIGIAASNSLLLVHFANDRRLEDERVGPAEAALFAGRTRLRPVLMTALAMILGMLPMALALGEAGQQNAPLGRAVIGGLVVSTFATLIVIPCAYAVFRKKRPSQAEHDRIVAEADAGTERAR
ncbi:MAG: efflux RND transporter permease subunit [Polyangiaceae bacterium]|nr:efflux RND transporter permease subunit [Polyangiaceae bacterium]